MCAMIQIEKKLNEHCNYWENEISECRLLSFKYGKGNILKQKVFSHHRKKKYTT